MYVCPITNLTTNKDKFEQNEIVSYGRQLIKVDLVMVHLVQFKHSEVLKETCTHDGLVLVKEMSYSENFYSSAEAIGSRMSVYLCVSCLFRSSLVFSHLCIISMFENEISTSQFPYDSESVLLR